MTPKEKAKELVDKFIKHTNSDWDLKDIISAQQCAIIAVDEILDNRCGMRNGEFIADGDIYCSENYWNEVKTEINNL